MLTIFSYRFEDIDYTQLVWIKNSFVGEQHDEFGLTTVLMVEKEVQVDKLCVNKQAHPRIKTY